MLQGYKVIYTSIASYYHHSTVVILEVFYRSTLIFSPYQFSRDAMIFDEDKSNGGECQIKLFHLRVYIAP